MNKYRVLGLNADWGRPFCDGKYGGVGWYRIINPLEKIGADVQRGEFTIGIFPHGAQSMLDLKKRGDIWVTKPMDSMDVVAELVIGSKFAGAKLVLDLDDDPFNLNPDHPAYKDFMAKRPQYESFIKGADHIIVSSEHIKSVIEHLNDKITVIPNGIDPEIWKVNGRKRKDGKIRIGWFGSASHMADMDIILPVVEQIEKKYPNVEFHLAGMVIDDIQEGQRFHHAPTKGYEEYPQWLADKDLDIAIAPLKDTQFNRCKTNIKWLEHSMLKTPMVLSNVTPYKESVENYKTGYLAGSTAQWVKYLSWLIESPEKRKEIGENAYKEVIKRLVD
jgi:glycosyltransferase involved in cell wall biosynthesis